MNVTCEMNDFSEYVEALRKIHEQEFLRDAQAKQMIDDAVLIMNPKYKEIIVESGIGATVLWSSQCPEEKCYMITDEDLKREIKRNQSMYFHKEVNADADDESRSN